MQQWPTITLVQGHFEFKERLFEKLVGIFHTYLGPNPNPNA